MHKNLLHNVHTELIVIDKRKTEESWRGGGGWKKRSHFYQRRMISCVSYLSLPSPYQYIFTFFYYFQLKVLQSGQKMNDSNGITHETILSRSFAWGASLEDWVHFVYFCGMADFGLTISAMKNLRANEKSIRVDLCVWSR